MTTRTFFGILLLIFAVVDACCMALWIWRGDIVGTMACGGGAIAGVLLGLYLLFGSKSKGKAGLVLLALLWAGPAQASDSWWLSVVAYPAIPGWSTRHVQVLHETFSAGGVDAGDMHQFQRLSEAEGQVLADALLAWDGSNGTLYHRQRNVTKGVARATWTLDAVAQAGKVLIASFSVVWIVERNPYCPSCAPAQTSTHQTARLDPEEVSALGNALADWSQGWNPADAIVWDRVNQQ